MMKKKICTYLEVEHDHFQDVSEPPDPNDSWSRGTTISIHTVNGLKKVNEKDFFDLIIDEKVRKGTGLYVVYGIYTTGDSFGTDVDGRIEFFSVHRKEEVALRNADILRKASGNNVKLRIDSGEIFETYIPWNGYFERLTEVVCKKLKVK